MSHNEKTTLIKWNIRNKRNYQLQQVRWNTMDYLLRCLLTRGTFWQELPPDQRQNSSSCWWWCVDLNNTVDKVEDMNIKMKIYQSDQMIIHLGRELGSVSLHSCPPHGIWRNDYFVENNWMCLWFFNCIVVLYIIQPRSRVSIYYYCCYYYYYCNSVVALGCEFIEQKYY